MRPARRPGSDFRWLRRLVYRAPGSLRAFVSLLDARTWDGVGLVFLSIGGIFTACSSSNGRRLRLFV